METLNFFKEVAKNPYKYAVDYKEKTGKPIMGYFCSYTPEEIISAAGALPFRIFGSNDNISLANSHLQTYCCSLVRGGLEDALSNKLHFLNGTVFPHTCDSIQRLSDIWRLNAGFDIHLDIVLPVKLNSQSAKDYMTDIIHKFRRDLQKKLNIEITDEQLQETIKVYNKFRANLAKLYDLRRDNPDIITGSQVYDVVKSSMLMDKKEFNGLIESLIKNLIKSNNNNNLSKNKRVVLAGGVCNHPDIYSLIEESGGVVVGDELCTGSRYFEGQINEKEEPVNAISNRYIDRITCPAKHKNTTSRGENLVKLAKNHNADGVVFLILKFCDPHSFDYPYMKKLLDDVDIPNMLMEIEEKLPPEGQLKTRFESFIEML